MEELFKKYILHKRVLILGFGREGQSTYRYLKATFPDQKIAIADQNINLNLALIDQSDRSNLILGAHYLDAIDAVDVIIKSPGISMNGKAMNLGGKTLLSQTGLFMERFKDQIIGITGTKGKSTTASLVYHILMNAGKRAVLVGNIGQPPLDLLSEISPDTQIIFELSAHQLEFVNDSPHLAILLNLFPEHLDYFKTQEYYYRSKLNITCSQNESDFFVFDDENSEIPHQLKKIKTKANLLPIEFPSEDEDGVNAMGINTRLSGRHNLKNIYAAKIACEIVGIPESEIFSGIESFSPLEHRLEFVGNICGIDFYNDSISTIPESAIAAVKTIKHTQTMILGGFDRGLDYTNLVLFLATSSVENFIFIGAAGLRMMEELKHLKSQGQQSFFIQNFVELGALMLKTPKGKACLLSPAASSYDQFQDFEERGRMYKKIAEGLKPSAIK